MHALCHSVLGFRFWPTCSSPKIMCVGRYVAKKKKKKFGLISLNRMIGYVYTDTYKPVKLNFVRYEEAVSFFPARYYIQILETNKQASE